MNPQLVDLIFEYDQSLTRIDREKDLQKEMAKHAHRVHDIDSAAFQVVLTAYHAGKTQELWDLSCNLKSMLEEIRNEEKLAR